MTAVRSEDNQYLRSANGEAAPTSPILNIDPDTAGDHERLALHAHPEPMLTWSSTATLVGNVDGRDWLIPPGHGLWVPGDVEHSGEVLHTGEMVTITFAAGRNPLGWDEPTSFTVGPLLGELIGHLHRVGPDDPTRPATEALMFQLLIPLPSRHLHLVLPTDPRARRVAEHLIAHPDDPRELAGWAVHLHTSVRTLSRLFHTETGISFVAWRTRARIRAAIPLLGSGASVGATARAVGYRRPSAFITAFQRVTGHTPGTYLPGSP